MPSAPLLEFSNAFQNSYSTQTFRNDNINIGDVKDSVLGIISEFFNGKKICFHPFIQSIMNPKDCSILFEAFTEIPEVRKVTSDFNMITKALKDSPHVIFDEKARKIMPKYLSRSCLILKDIPSKTTIEDMKPFFLNVEPKPVYIEIFSDSCWYVYFEGKFDAHKCLISLQALNSAFINNLNISLKAKDAPIPNKNLFNAPLHSPTPPETNDTNETKQLSQPNTETISASAYVQSQPNSKGAALTNGLELSTMTVATSTHLQGLNKNLIGTDQLINGYVDDSTLDIVSSNDHIATSIFMGKKLSNEKSFKSSDFTDASKPDGQPSNINLLKSFDGYNNAKQASPTTINNNNTDNNLDQALVMSKGTKYNKDRSFSPNAFHGSAFQTTPDSLNSTYKTTQQINNGMSIDTSFTTTPAIVNGIPLVASYLSNAATSIMADGGPTLGNYNHPSGSSSILPPPPFPTMYATPAAHQQHPPSVYPPAHLLPPQAQSLNPGVKTQLVGGGNSNHLNNAAPIVSLPPLNLNFNTYGLIPLNGAATATGNNGLLGGLSPSPAALGAINLNLPHHLYTINALNQPHHQPNGNNISHPSLPFVPPLPPPTGQHHPSFVTHPLNYIANNAPTPIMSLTATGASNTVSLKFAGPPPPTIPANVAASTNITPTGNSAVSNSLPSAPGAPYMPTNAGGAGVLSNTPQPLMPGFPSNAHNALNGATANLINGTLGGFYSPKTSAYLMATGHGNANSSVLPTPPYKLGGMGYAVNENPRHVAITNGYYSNSQPPHPNISSLLPHHKKFGNGGSYPNYKQNEQQLPPLHHNSNFVSPPNYMIGQPLPPLPHLNVFPGSKLSAQQSAYPTNNHQNSLASVPSLMVPQGGAGNSNYLTTHTPSSYLLHFHHQSHNNNNSGSNISLGLPPSNNGSTHSFSSQLPQPSLAALQPYPLPLTHLHNNNNSNKGSGQHNNRRYQHHPYNNGPHHHHGSGINVSNFLLPQPSPTPVGSSSSPSSLSIDNKPTYPNSSAYAAPLKNHYMAQTASYHRQYDSANSSNSSNISAQQYRREHSHGTVGNNRYSHPPPSLNSPQIVTLDGYQPYPPPNHLSDGQNRNRDASSIYHNYKKHATQPGSKHRSNFAEINGQYQFSTDNTYGTAGYNQNYQPEETSSQPSSPLSSDILSVTMSSVHNRQRSIIDTTVSKGNHLGGQQLKDTNHVAGRLSHHHNLVGGVTTNSSDTSGSSLSLVSSSICAPDTVGLATSHTNTPLSKQYSPMKSPLACTNTSENYNFGGAASYRNNNDVLLLSPSKITSASTANQSPATTELKRYESLQNNMSYPSASIFKNFGPTINGYEENDTGMETTSQRGKSSSALKNNFSLEEWTGDGNALLEEEEDLPPGTKLSYAQALKRKNRQRLQQQRQMELNALALDGPGNLANDYSGPPNVISSIKSSTEPIIENKPHTGNKSTTIKDTQERSNKPDNVEISQENGISGEGWLDDENSLAGFVKVTGGGGGRNQHSGPNRHASKKQHQQGVQGNKPGSSAENHTKGSNNAPQGTTLKNGNKSRQPVIPSSSLPLTNMSTVVSSSPKGTYNNTNNKTESRGALKNDYSTEFPAASTAVANAPSSRPPQSKQAASVARSRLEIADKSAQGPSSKLSPSSSSSFKAGRGGGPTPPQSSNTSIPEPGKHNYHHQGGQQRYAPSKKESHISINNNNNTNNSSNNLGPRNSYSKVRRLEDLPFHPRNKVATLAKIEEAKKKASLLKANGPTPQIHGTNHHVNKPILRDPNGTPTLSHSSKSDHGNSVPKHLNVANAGPSNDNLNCPRSSNIVNVNKDNNSSIAPTTISSCDAPANIPAQRKESFHNSSNSLISQLSNQSSRNSRNSINKKSALNSNNNNNTSAVKMVKPLNVNKAAAA